MQGYFVQFVAYTMAMVGFISVCLFTYKKFYQQPMSSNGADCLCIENALRLNPKKQIYVVRAGNERFLVASDAETTTMLAKLDDNQKTEEVKTEEKTPIVLKKAAPKKHLQGINNVLGLKTEEYPLMKRIAEKMKA